MANDTKTDTIKLISIQKDLEYIKKKVDQIELDLKADYVTRAEWEPYKKVISGLVGAILLTVLGALLALVVQQ